MTDLKVRTVPCMGLAIIASAALAGGALGQCPGVDNLITVEILTDNYGSETTWELADQDGILVASGGGYASNTLYVTDVPVDSTCSYSFTIFDAWGDGICCGWGTGYYNIYCGGQLFQSGGEFGASETVLIGADCTVPFGACCEFWGECLGDMSPPDCAALGGEFFDGESCEGGSNPADLNGNGVVDFGDLLIILDPDVWGSTDHPADLNGNGVVDFGDLLVILDPDVWGSTGGGDPFLCPGPCVSCADGSIDEGECIDFDEFGFPCDTNGGCNMAVPAWSPIAPGDTVCGLAITYVNPDTGGNTRDTDWYEMTLAEDSVLTLTCESTFYCIFGPIADANGVPSTSCATAAAINPANWSNACEGPVTFVWDCMPAGSYWFFVGPGDFTGAPVGGVYNFSITAETCVQEVAACCDFEGFCSDLTATECTAIGGTFYTGETCATFSCPVGACCIGLACEPDLPAGICSQLGGTWYEGELCENIFCGGACCLDGVCEPGLTEADCTALGGIYFNGEDCDAGYECPTCANDTQETATVIPGLPYSGGGDTRVCSNLYDGLCELGGSTAPEAVFTFTPAADVTVDIVLCESGHDTKLYVLDVAAGVLVACVDDSCSNSAGDPFRSDVAGLALTGGMEYHIFCDGWGSSAGPFTIEMFETP